MLLVWIDINMWVYYCTLSFSWSVFTFLGVNLPTYTVLDPLHDQYVNVPILQATAPWYSTTIQDCNCTAVVVCCYSVCMTCLCMYLYDRMHPHLQLVFHTNTALFKVPFQLQAIALLFHFRCCSACALPAVGVALGCRFKIWYKSKIQVWLFNIQYCLIRLNAISSDKFALAAQLVRARIRHL